ncbi:MAG: YbjN domain-containing protein [Pseudomonadota bacterium]
MRKNVKAVVAAVSIGLSGIAWSSHASAAGVTKTEITEALTSSGYSVQDVQAKMIAVTIGERVVFIGLDGADADVSYITYFSEVDLGLGGHSFMSKFNSQVKFGRAYIDRDGDIALQMDRNSSGGVSIDNISSDFDVFLQLITKFLSDLQAQGSV